MVLTTVRTVSVLQQEPMNKVQDQKCRTQIALMFKLNNEHDDIFYYNISDLFNDNKFFDDVLENYTIRI